MYTTLLVQNVQEDLGGFAHHVRPDTRLSHAYRLYQLLRP